MEGLSQTSILFNSSMILSFESMDILPLFLLMDSRDSGTIMNFLSSVLSFVANLIARIILRGSSL